MPIPSDSGNRDPYLWLEEVEGADALAWVAERNRATHAALATGQPGFDALRARLRAAFDAEDRIPHLRKLGERYYNFWQDEGPRLPLATGSLEMSPRSAGADDGRPMVRKPGSDLRWLADSSLEVYTLKCHILGASEWKSAPSP